MLAALGFSRWQDRKEFLRHLMCCLWALSQDCGLLELTEVFMTLYHMASEVKASTATVG